LGSISDYDYSGDGVNDTRGYTADGEQNVADAIQKLVELTLD